MIMYDMIQYHTYGDSQLSQQKQNTQYKPEYSQQ